MPGKVTQGSMKTSGGQPLPLVRTDVEALINGPLGDITVKQLFRNNTPQKIEAVYSFPLSHEGSVYRFSFRIGNREVHGVIKEKEEAKATYEAAKSEGRAASLLEQDKENLFTMSVANIDAGAEIEVTMGYQEKLPFDAGEYRFVFPMVTTEAYDNTVAPSPATGASGSGTVRQQAVEGQATNRVSLKVTLDPGVEIQPPRCLSHDITIAADPVRVNAYVITLKQSESMPNRDFVLAYNLANASQKPVLYFERAHAQEAGNLLLVLPPPDASIALRGRKPADFLFLIDRSYSMRGGSLRQAKNAIDFLLQPLTPEDGVQVMLFDHDLEAFGEGAQWQSATPDIKQAIANFLDKIAPRGGTELELALWSALENFQPRPNRQKIICLLTDAAVEDDTRLMEVCEELVKSEKAKLYVLGVGPSVNRLLVDRLAKKAQGASEVLLPREEDIIPTCSRFRDRLLTAGPVITGLQVEFQGITVTDIFPRPLPDLFLGQPLQVCGQYTGGGQARVKIFGDIAGGSPFEITHDFTAPGEAWHAHRGISRTWARWQIDHLQDLQKDLDAVIAQPDRDLKYEIIKLSFEHVLMSSHTSFVAEEVNPNASGDSAPVNVSVTFPARDGATINLTGLTRISSVDSILVRAAIAFKANYRYSYLTIGSKTYLAYESASVKLKEIEALLANTAAIFAEDKPYVLQHRKEDPLQKVRQQQQQKQQQQQQQQLQPLSYDDGDLISSGAEDDISIDDEEDDADEGGAESDMLRYMPESEELMIVSSVDAPPSPRSAPVPDSKPTSLLSRISSVFSKSASVAAPAPPIPSSESRPSADSSALPPPTLSSASRSSASSLAPSKARSLSSTSSLAATSAERPSATRSASLAATPSASLAATPSASPAAPLMRRSPVAKKDVLHEAEEEREAPVASEKKKKMVKPAKMEKEVSRKRESKARRSSFDFEEVLGGPTLSGGSGYKKSDVHANPLVPRKTFQRRDTHDFLAKASQSNDPLGQVTSIQVDSTAPKEIVEWAQKNNITGELDLVFCIDETGSMGSWISQVQQRVLDIVDAILRSPLCKSVRIGIVGYRDHPPQDSSFAARVFDFSSEKSVITSAVRQLQASGGGDGPETLTDGLYEVVRMAWRPSACRVCVVITDAPPHGLPGNHGDGFPNGCPCGFHWYTQAACMKEMGIVCYTVGCGLHGEVEQVYRAIAKVTKGVYVPLSNTALLVPLILGAAESVLDKQRLEHALLSEIQNNGAAYTDVADEDELIKKLTQAIQKQGLQVRKMLSNGGGKLELKFAPANEDDVVSSLFVLRRTGAVQL